MARQIGQLGEGIVESAHPSSRKQHCALARTLGQAGVTAEPPATAASCSAGRAATTCVVRRVERERVDARLPMVPSASRHQSSASRPFIRSATLAQLRLARLVRLYGITGKVSRSNRARLNNVHNARGKRAGAQAVELRPAKLRARTPKPNTGRHLTCMTTCPCT